MIPALVSFSFSLRESRHAESMNYLSDVDVFSG